MKYRFSISSYLKKEHTDVTFSTELKLFLKINRQFLIWKYFQCSGFKLNWRYLHCLSQQLIY